MRARSTVASSDRTRLAETYSVLTGYHRRIMCPVAVHAYLADITSSSYTWHWMPARIAA